MNMVAPQAQEQTQTPEPIQEQIRTVPEPTQAQEQITTVPEPITDVYWDVARSIIDQVALEHRVYRYSRGTRAGCCLCSTACCFPCILYSSVMRLLSCPAHCLCGDHGCNPLRALLTDSVLTRKSDGCCHTAYCKVAEKRVVHMAPCMETNIRIILYAADKIRVAKDPRSQYAVADAVAVLVCILSRSLSNISLSSVTPVAVIELASRLMHLRKYNTNSTNNTSNTC